MKIIITGGSGQIGSAFAERMAADGNSVYLLSRNPAKVPVPAGAQVVKWDGKTPEGWQDLADGAGAVVNLAGENIGAGKWTSERKQRILSSRLDAGKAVLAAIAASQNKPLVLLQASAVGYYGPHGDEILTESASPGKDFLSEVAIQWESVTKEVEDLGVRRVVLRTGVVLDPKKGILPRFLLPFRLFAGGPMGSGRQWISWIHLIDQVDAMRFLIHNPSVQGAVNLVAPQPVTNAWFGRILAKVIRRPYWLPVPAFAFRLLFGEMSTLILDGQRVVPTRLLEAGYQFHFSDLEGALQELLAK
ncbi:MAG TPA: TIGR01777 family oxidoreductase [Anaerolineaceae bacterium]